MGRKNKAEVRLFLAAALFGGLVIAVSIPRIPWADIKASIDKTVDVILFDSAKQAEQFKEKYSRE